MVSDIQPNLPSLVTGRMDPAPKVPLVAGASPVAAEIKPHKLELPKADIKYDAEHAKKNLDEAIQKLNDMLKDSGRTISFSMDVKLGRPIVFVKNMANGDVIRQIPNEVVVRIAHGIEDFKGLLHNADS